MQKLGFFEYWISRIFNLWISIEFPPDFGKRVLVKNKQGEVHIGRIIQAGDQPERWLLCKVRLNKKDYEFLIDEPLTWKEIPK